jgi:stage IV sporulation protein FB
MVRFTLFGIPIEIQPWFWVTGALLGGAISADSRKEYLDVLLFMLAAAISILVHELGHALVGRRLSGSRPRIVLWSLGGLAYNEGGRFTRSGLFWMTAAGPLAGFLFALLLVLGLCAGLGPESGINLSSALTFRNWLWAPSQSLYALVVNQPLWLILLNHFLWINVWWGIINLLPILPLDGGRIAELFLKPRVALTISAFLGLGMALFGYFILGSLWTAIMFGFLAYQNYQQISSSPR